MAKWRKKPVVVEAEEYKYGMEDGLIDIASGLKCSNEWEEYYKENGFPKNVALQRRMDRPTPVPIIKTLEGDLLITPNDFIITGVKGERYPCKPEIFHMTYEKAYCEVCQTEDNDDEEFGKCDACGLVMCEKCSYTDTVGVPLCEKCHTEMMKED